MNTSGHTRKSRAKLAIGLLLTASILVADEVMALDALPSWLEIEAQLEIEVAREQNVDLEPPRSDTLHVLRPELQLETWIMPRPGITGFLLLELAHEFDLQDETDHDELTHAEFSIQEAFITLTGPALAGMPLTLQIGRQSYEDKRQWLYDDELDAIRAVFHLSRFRLEASLARLALFDRDLGNHEGTNHTRFYHLDAQYTFGPFLTLAAYGLVLDDRLAEGERPVFIGLRARGKLELGLYYWLDVAHVRGKSEELRLRGWGLDVGLLYVLDVVTEPLLILSYAFGSGDDTPENATDTSFRQTGLEGNGSPYESVTDIQYYGELLDPELSNLHIFTVGLGFRPLEDASLTVLYHLYRQHQRSDEFRDVAIEAEPTGLNRDIGSELDVIGGWELEPVELELIFGVFFPGDAFEPEVGNAFFAAFRLTVEF